MNNKKRLSFEELKLQMQDSKQNDLKKIAGGILGACHNLAVAG